MAEEDDEATMMGGTQPPGERPEISHRDFPSEIGHYTIEGLIGAGGMGQVYRGTDTRLGRAVAIKVLPASFLNDVPSLERFKREAQVLRLAQSPQHRDHPWLRGSGAAQGAGARTRGRRDAG